MKNIYSNCRVLFVCLLASLLLAGCFGAPMGSDSEADKTDIIDHTLGVPSAKIATLNMANDYPLFDHYYIAPGDILDVVYNLERRLQDARFEINLYHSLDIKFLGASELDISQDVLPDGTISLPYFGSYPVIGKTSEELKNELEKAYARYLRYPEVVVEIRNINARVEQIRTDLRTAGRGLSKLVTVRQDGYASFPMIGEFYVAKRTIAQVSTDIIEAYERYMPGLKANLFLHEQTGTNIYVMGEVKDPGAYDINRPVNILQAIAMAGGYTQEGQTENLVVFRRNGDRLDAHRFNIKDMAQYGAHATSFYLQPEDIVLVPRSKVSSFAQLMSEIADITFFQGLGLGINYDIP
ncbi:polysaccharide biosynthesis/export family protein [Oceanobacter mangrovi]|uniref:polysaccharide biosynthesis/export family protein n=1 Tax=Oceanobacter mangrovi TaxID=2862510 RepID=UPI001C8D4FAA|nr:polysaccharide biosynthesis/export family protein [Oceanobacter mangrovi]